MIYIYHVEFEKGLTGYTAIQPQNDEKLIEAITLGRFIRLAESDDVTVSRNDLTMVLKEINVIHTLNNAK